MQAVSVAEEDDFPAELIRLQSDAYQLSLPSGAQLRWVSRSARETEGEKSQDGGDGLDAHDPLHEIGEALDKDRQLVQLYNSIANEETSRAHDEVLPPGPLKNAIAAYRRNRAMPGTYASCQHKHEALLSEEAEISAMYNAAAEDFAGVNKELGDLESLLDERQTALEQLRNSGPRVGRAREYFNQSNALRQEIRDIHAKILARKRRFSALERECEALDKELGEVQIQSRQARCEVERVRGYLISISPELLAGQLADIRAGLLEVMNQHRSDLDQTLEQALANPGSGRVGAYHALRLALRETNTLRGVRTDWRYWEMLGVSPADFDDVMENPDVIEDWLDQGFSTKEALSFKNAGFAIEDVAHLRASGMTGPLARDLERFGYTREFFAQFKDGEGKPIPAVQLGFVLGNHHDAWSEDQAWKIGSGAFSTPMQGHFTSPGDDQEAGSLWVFKKEQVVADASAGLQPGEMQADEAAGVLADFMSPETIAAPRFGARNVAAYRVAQKLGWPVIAETEFAARTVPLTDAERKAYADRNGIALDQVPQQRHSFGIMMKKAQQVDTQRWSEPELDAKLRRSLVQLHLIDHIIGQADRHNHNFIVTADGVVGIDNDQCFPDRVQDPLELAGGNSEAARVLGLMGLGLPLVIDEQIRSDILALDAAELGQALRGLLTEGEIAATLERLRLVKDWVGREQLKVIEPRLDAWASSDVADHLRARMPLEVYVADDQTEIARMPDEVDTSYYVRLFE